MTSQKITVGIKYPITQHKTNHSSTPYNTKQVKTHHVLILFTVMEHNIIALVPTRKRLRQRCTSEIPLSYESVFQFYPKRCTWPTAIKKECIISATLANSSEWKQKNYYNAILHNAQYCSALECNILLYIEFKIAVWVWRGYIRSAPVYLRDLCCPTYSFVTHGNPPNK